MLWSMKQVYKVDHKVRRQQTYHFITNSRRPVEVKLTKEEKADKTDMSLKIDWIVPGEKREQMIGIPYSGSKTLGVQCWIGYF